MLQIEFDTPYHKILLCVLFFGECVSLLFQISSLPNVGAKDP
jgi:hypothetical protein